MSRQFLTRSEQVTDFFNLQTFMWTAETSPARFILLRTATTLSVKTGANQNNQISNDSLIFPRCRWVRYGLYPISLPKERRETLSTKSWLGACLDLKMISELFKGNDKNDLSHRWQPGWKWLSAENLKSNHLFWLLKVSLS